MACRKCQGFMVREWCGDSTIESYVWRCVNCGGLIYPPLKPTEDTATMVKRLLEQPCCV